MRANLRFGSRAFAGIAAAFGLALLGLGCPAYYYPPGPGGGGGGGGGTTDPQTEYDTGFEAGFALDDWYWDGYFDGYDTVDATPIYYDDSEIPYVEDPAYDAGYWDGVWYAYNDGYFVDYHYAFVLGFSEGYDNAFWPDYLDFLASDVHVELWNGGWSDGYNDGFSEGRVFGANDYEQGIQFNWLDALWDYQAGTDLYFAEVGYGTGDLGPVTLYEYGENPNYAKDAGPKLAERPRAQVKARGIRQGLGAKAAELDADTLFRSWDPDAEAVYAYTPSASLRSDRALRLATTWLERLEAYRYDGKHADAVRAETGGAAPTARARAVPTLDIGTPRAD